MPPIQNSPQYQEQTTSNNGRNVRAASYALSHFFLENNSFTQTAANSFGAVSATEFNTTAKVSFSGTKKVYSICQGQIFVQPQDGSTDKVNVILKPFKQPFPSLPIKYFIYRGLNKSDFFTSVVYNGASRLQIAGSATTGTGLVQYIWKEFNNFYTGTSGTQPVFLEEFIGFPATATSQQTNDLIDQYFFKLAQYSDTTGQEVSGGGFELPLIPRGIQIGNATGDVGIDVVLNSGDYHIENDLCPFQFNLAFARSSYYKLQTSGTHTAFENKLSKEMSTRFMDIAALYGLHAGGNGKLYVGETVNPYETKEDIYTQIQNFYTKNIVYLYIQSNRQRSYNFYGNYVESSTVSNNLRLGSSASNVTETIFGDNGWPVHKITNATANLALTLITDNTSDASAYVQTGFVTSEHEDNFVRNENLVSSDGDTDTEVINYTLPILFSLPVVSSNTVSSVVQMLYEGRKFTIGESGGDTLYQAKDIDDVFGMLDAIPSTQGRSTLDLPIVSDNKPQIINFPNKDRKDDIGIVKVKKIKDAIATDDQQVLQRVTYETILDSVRQEKETGLAGTSPNLDNAATGTVSYQPDLTNNFYQPDSPYFLQTSTFSDAEDAILGINLYTDDLSIPAKKILGISEAENQTLKDVVTQQSLTNAKIFFQNSLSSEDDSYLSTENINYKKYSLLVSGEDSNGDVLMYTPGEDVTVYTLDGFAYFSPDYSKYMQSLEETISINYQIPEE